MRKTFGPVPSRRLGQSLGINNIPPKICPYSCIYCQIGTTLKMEVKRKEFYKPEEIVKDVQERIRQIKGNNQTIDYLSFVPDGEPTLDINLGKEIELLKSLGIKIAVITNGSLIWQRDVREDLAKADWVSFKVDAVTSDIWYKIDKPHKSLKLKAILAGMVEFSKIFKGELTTETMLIQGVNDSRNEIKKISSFLEKLNPHKVYIAIPTRPPAKKGVLPATEQVINMAYQIFSKKLSKVEYLIGYEGNAFGFTGNVEEDLLNITSVHPMREEGVNEFLAKSNAKWDIIEELIKNRKLIELEYQGKKFYMRKFFAS